MPPSSPEINTVLGEPGDVFLRDCWQKKLHAFRGAVEIPASLPTLADLKVLASSNNVDARIVIGPDEAGRWEVHHGPFEAAEFHDLPETGWTLLIQDLDKLRPEIAEMWSWFGIIPEWRRDDIMISFASPGGSVGPHFDRYDVFLVQAVGKRTWTTGKAGPAINSALTDELKLCRIDQPVTHQTFAAGDVLYLPPNQAHHGVAETCCMTLSFGMRAPTMPEMVFEYSQEIAERHPDLRYSDADLSVDEQGPWLHPLAIERFRTLLMAGMELDEKAFAKWAARLLTTYAARRESPPGPAQEQHQVEQSLRAGRRARWSPWCQRLGLSGSSDASLIVDGESYTNSHETVALLLENQEFAWNQTMGDSGLELIASLVHSGQMIWADHD